MKTRFQSFLAGGAVALAQLAAFSGCASLPLRNVTTEYTSAGSADIAGLTPPAPLRTVDPLFPYEMKRAGISGFVRVVCLVDESGRVKDPVAEYASHAAFIDPALAAVRLWTFTPAYRNGVATPLRVNLPMQFTFAE